MPTQGRGASLQGRGVSPSGGHVTVGHAPFEALGGGRGPFAVGNYGGEGDKSENSNNNSHNSTDVPFPLGRGEGMEGLAFGAPRI